MAMQGTCKSFNGLKGWGFAECNGADIFLHINDCSPADKQPVKGDVLFFNIQPKEGSADQMQAKDITGCTGRRENMVHVFKGPVDGTGAYTGVVKAFGAKGFGFITSDADGTDVFMHLKDCVGSKPQVGDKVKFDIGESDTKPGVMQARNITGGALPLDPPGSFPGKGGWGKGDMGMGMGMMGGKGMKGMKGMMMGGWGPMKGGLMGGAMMGGGMMGGPYGGKGWGMGW
eukprot:TRINITY_DN2552_c0_g2_i1.p1 TRINITY_DN2552_c0_g2~~TRINITY_DN2552_c0_g2_i1.p1  ORF type:complete len:229 (-),score=69.20 TRINITY_DN2552_c0_g2_i1:148-834(-)